MTRIVVRILVAVVIPQLLHQLSRCIADRQWNRLITRLSNQCQCSIDAQIGRITLWRRSQIDRTLRQSDASLGPSNLHHRIESSIGQQQRIGISQPDILGSRDHQSTGDELRILTTLTHASHPIESSIRIATSDTFDKGRDDVIVHLAVLIVGQRILLQACFHQFVGDDHIAILRLHHQFQDIQQFTGIATAIAQQSIGLFQLNISFTEHHILC